MADRYSETIMQHFLEPQNRGTLEHPNGVGLWGRPGEGPFFVIQVRLDGGRIIAAAFQCHNCGVTVAAGSVLTTLVKGCSVEDCLGISAGDLATALEGVPPDKLHVPESAVLALRQAIQKATHQ